MKKKLKNLQGSCSGLGGGEEDGRSDEEDDEGGSCGDDDEDGGNDEESCDSLSGLIQKALHFPSSLHMQTKHCQIISKKKYSQTNEFLNFCFAQISLFCVTFLTGAAL